MYLNGMGIIFERQTNAGSKSFVFTSIKYIYITRNYQVNQTTEVASKSMLPSIIKNVQ